MFRAKENPWFMITIGSMLGYLLFGLFDSLKGSTLSSLLEEMSFNYSLGGTIVMGQYAGYFAATLFVGMLADRYGQKVCLIAAGVSMSLGMVGYSFSSAVPLFVVFIFCMGMGLGALELVGCNIITTCYPEKKGRYLNILTAIAGIGSILSPIIVGYLLDTGLSWRMVYRYGLLIMIPSAFYFIMIRVPVHTRESRMEVYSEESGNLWQRNLLLMYIFNFLYMAAEMGIATWIVNFYRQEKLYSVADSTRFLSLFYIGMTAGRVAGSFFVDRVGRVRSVLVAAAGSVLCIWLGVFGPMQLSGAVAFAGLFYSIVFPTGTAIMSGLPSGDLARTQGVYFACGGLGGMFGPWAMGIVSDLFGLKWGMTLGGIFSLSIFFIIMLLRNTNEKQ